MQTPTDDPTLRLLQTIADGSLAGLANYHLMKLQLDNLRNLPEPSDRDRNVRPG
jgi:hypothetical protein